MRFLLAKLEQHVVLVYFHAQIQPVLKSFMEIEKWKIYPQSKIFVVQTRIARTNYFSDVETFRFVDGAGKAKKFGCFIAIPARAMFQKERVHPWKNPASRLRK